MDFIIPKSPLIFIKILLFNDKQCYTYLIFITDQYMI